MTASDIADLVEDAEKHKEDDAPLVRRRRRAVDPSQVFSVRIPVDHLERLRVMARQKGTHPSSLIRQWVIERLDGTLPVDPDAAVRRMADIVGEMVTATMQTSTASLRNDQAKALREIKTLVAELSTSQPRSNKRRRTKSRTSAG